MHKPLFNRVAILGLGLIGSSLARALTEGKLTPHIAAFDISQDALRHGVAGNFVHSHHAHAGQASEGADLIVFAAPPAALETLARDIAPFVKKGAIVTDTASVKRQAIAAIKPHLPAHAHFVPAHPIAGSEKTGATAGRADLFAGKQVILTPEESDVLGEPVARVRALWEEVGAKTECMPAELHDHIYAYVSHLPQIVAFAVAPSLRNLPPGDNEPLIRFIRLTKSDPKLWADICVANADYTREALADFMTFAAQMAGELAQSPTESNGDATVAAALFSKVIATCLIAAASLLQERTAVHPAHYAGSGFADMTAPATDDPEAALAAISAHHKAVAKMLGGTLGKLQEIKDALGAKDRGKLVKLFS